MQDKKKVKEFLKYVFSDDEKAEIAQEMAKKVSEKQTAEDEKKAIMSEFKAKIDGYDAEINSMAMRLNNGYEHLQIECEIEADYERKVWVTRRLDTYAIVKEKKMSSDDLQMKVE